LLGAIGPRPIAFASTVDAEGRSNLAPFSFFNVFSANPPILIFSPARSGRLNTTKDTYNNVKVVPEVVINIVNYDIASIKIKQDEYIQSNYINKEIYKVLSNLFKLKNQYLGRFLVEYTTPNNNLTYAQSLLGENLVYKGYTYLDDYNFLSINNINDFYIHENEKVTASVFNRCIKNIYNLQLEMLQQSTQKNKTLVQYLTSGGTLVVS
jgi:hypothetical protein